MAKKKSFRNLKTPDSLLKNKKRELIKQGKFKIHPPEARVCILLIAAVFDEWAEALKFSLKEIGFRYINITNKKEDISADLCFVFPALKNYRPSNNGYRILVQAEELWNRRERGFYDLSSWYDICLELYEENTKIKQGTNNVIFCPLGYSSVFESNLEIDEDLDGFFFGSITKRRNNFLNILHNKYNIYTPKAIWGKERDINILRAKININIKAHDKWFYTPLRSLMIQCKKKFLLCEKTSGGYGPFISGKHFIEFKNKTDMVDKFDYYLKHDNERKEFALNAYEDIKKNIKYTDILKAALKNIF